MGQPPHSTSQPAHALESDAAPFLFCFFFLFEIVPFLFPVTFPFPFWLFLGQLRWIHRGIYAFCFLPLLSSFLFHFLFGFSLSFLFPFLFLFLLLYSLSMCFLCIFPWSGGGQSRGGFVPGLLAGATLPGAGRAHRCRTLSGDHDICMNLWEPGLAC